MIAAQALGIPPTWGWIVPAGLVGAAVWVLGRVPLRRSRARARLGEFVDVQERVWEAPAAGSELTRRRWLALVPAVAVVLLASLSGGLGLLLSLALGAVVLAVGLQIEALWHEGNCARLEAALAHSVDLIAAALLSGTSIQQALGTAATRSSEPLRGWLEELLERLRIGEPPPRLFAELAERVPLEGFRLFGIALSTSWESGGRYGEALARAGRAIRDRLALRRRVRSQSIETRFSMFGVLALTWVLFALAISSDPERMRSFARSELGGFLLAAALFLQALGIQWIDRLTREEL